MLYLAVDSGMRPQEYLALSHSAILDNGVFIDRAIDGSGNSISVTKTQAGRRKIELSPKTMRLLKDYAENHSQRNDISSCISALRWKYKRHIDENQRYNRKIYSTVRFSCRTVCK